MLSFYVVQVQRLQDHLVARRRKRWRNFSLALPCPGLNKQWTWHLENGQDLIFTEPKIRMELLPSSCGYYLICHSRILKWIGLWIGNIQEMNCQYGKMHTNSWIKTLWYRLLQTTPWRKFVKTVRLKEKPT